MQVTIEISDEIAIQANQIGFFVQELITIRDKTWINSPTVSDIEIALPPLPIMAQKSQHCDHLKSKLGYLYESGLLLSTAIPCFF